MKHSWLYIKEIGNLRGKISFAKYMKNFYRNTMTSTPENQRELAETIKKLNKEIANYENKIIEFKKKYNDYLNKVKLIERKRIINLAKTALKK